MLAVSGLFEALQMVQTRSGKGAYAVFIWVRRQNLNTQFSTGNTSVKHGAAFLLRRCYCGFSYQFVGTDSPSAPWSYLQDIHRKWILCYPAESAIVHCPFLLFLISLYSSWCFPCTDIFGSEFRLVRDEGSAAVFGLSSFPFWSPYTLFLFSVLSCSFLQ